MTSGGTKIAAAELDRVRAWLEDNTSALLAPLHAYAAELLAAQDDGASATPHISAAAVERLAPTVESIIEGSPAAYGAGFIAAPYVVDGADRYMMWLQRRNGDVRRLRLNFDTADIDAYDYVGMDWYVATEMGRVPSLTGPFLDYSGSAALVFTLAYPVLADEHFLGVAAMDLLAESAEAQMTDQLCSLPSGVLVVNQNRTVVASNAVTWMPGERLSAMPSDDDRRFGYVAPIGDWTGWQLAALKPETGD
jgi:hypothetical protein